MYFVLFAVIGLTKDSRKIGASTMSLYTEIFTVLLTVILIVYIYFKYSYNYWKRKGIDYIEPSFPLGNCSSLLYKGISFGTFSKPFYDEFKRRGKAFGGIFTVSTPMLVFVDPRYTKDILLSDFNQFVDRGVHSIEKSDPISAHLLTYDETKWKNYRTKLSPAFTSSKLKFFFNIMVDICQNLIETLEINATNEDVDIHYMTSRFTTSVLGTAVYGVEVNSFKNVGPDFHKWSEKFNHASLLDSVVLFWTVYSPKLAKFLKLKTMNKNVSNFFLSVATEAIDFREKNILTATDIRPTLVNHKDLNDGFSMNAMASNCFALFVGGSDTSSITISFALCELARHQDYQDMLRREVRGILDESNGKFTYENLKKMKYLGQIIDETLRLYPPVPSLTRVCTSDHYKLRDSDLVLDRGTQVLISTIGLHRDPDYFPDPLRFDPERFNEENKKSIPPFVYMPFGEGPRNCIGLRFGLMQTKIGLASIINKFKVTLSPKTKYPIELRNDTFLLNTVDKILIRVEKIS